MGCKWDETSYFPRTVICCGGAEANETLPDALSFAKAMSGSLVPVGGVLASEKLYMDAYGSDETAFFHT